MTSIGMVTPEGPGRRRVARAGAAQLALPGLFLAMAGVKQGFLRVA